MQTEYIWYPILSKPIINSATVGRELKNLCIDFHEHEEKKTWLHSGRDPKHILYMSI